MAEHELGQPQLQAMQGLAYLEQLDPLLQVLRTTGADSGLDDERLRADTRIHLVEALRLGLRDPRDVLGFLSLRHSIGIGFWRLPKVRRQLQDASVAHGQRVFMLMLRTRHAYWVAAQRICQRRWGAGTP
jgi:hypothetical protein